jgi:ribonuclease-3
MSVNDGALEACQERIGYHFKDPALLAAALTHSSSANMRRDSNERLEFLGDAVLGLVVCHHLYQRLPEAMEGDLTKIKSAVVSRRACARVAQSLALPSVLHCGQGMDVGDDMPRSLAAAALESLVGAVFLDGGFEVAREFILKHAAEELRQAIGSEHHFNFKSQLQQYAQREMGCTPNYNVLDEKGPDHAKCFEVAASIGQRHFPSAWGPSKKDAEQKAAWAALVTLGVLSDTVPISDEVVS